MDNQQLVIFGMMAATDTLCGPRDADGRRREFTLDELDDLADFGWHVPDLKDAIAACVRVVRSCLRPRASSPLDPAALPPDAVTLQG